MAQVLWQLTQGLGGPFCTHGRLPPAFCPTSKPAITREDVAGSPGSPRHRPRRPPGSKPAPSASLPITRGYAAKCEPCFPSRWCATGLLHTRLCPTATPAITQAGAAAPSALEPWTLETLDARTLDARNLSRSKALDARNPGRSSLGARNLNARNGCSKPWTLETLDARNPGRSKLWSPETLRTRNPESSKPRHPPTKAQPLGAPHHPRASAGEVSVG